jgi:hypothetical protein
MYFNNIRSTVKDTSVFVLPTELKLFKIDTISALSTSYNTIYEHIIDSVELGRLKTELFLRKKVIAHIGMSSSSPLSSVFFHAGLYRFYSIIALSTDYYNSYRFGYGIGYTYNLANNKELGINVQRDLLFAGQSYDLGVRAILTHIDPYITFNISRDFKLSVGPSLYKSESNYVNANTELGDNYGIGALISIKFNIVSAILDK